VTPAEQARPPRGASNEFDLLVRPRSVAIVGASADAKLVGGQPLRFLTEFGYKGRIYPVNPKYPEMRGLPCFPEIAAVPQPCDLALIAVAASRVPEVLMQCGAAGIPFAVIISAGFRELGERGMENERKLQAAIRDSGVRVVGPNCIGLLNTFDHLHAGFGGAMSNPALAPGPFAMVSQSGGYGMGIVGQANMAGVGFSYMVSTGNETDIAALELVSYFLERDDVPAVMAFLEGVTDGRRLRAIGDRALELGKPVVLWKVGNTRSGRRAATSHTGRLSGAQTLFQRAAALGGFIEVSDTEDVIDFAQFLRYGKRAPGNRVCILTLSGGAGVLTADFCEENGLEVPETSPETIAKLRPLAPDFASLGNPIDLTPQFYGDGFASYTRIIREVLAAPEFDQAIVRSAPGSVVAEWIKGFVGVAVDSPKPICVNFGSGSEIAGDVGKPLVAANIPNFVSPRRAVRALAAWQAFGAKCRQYAERRARASARIARPADPDLPPGARTLGEHRSKEVLRAYGIPVVREVVVSPEALERMESPPFPFPLAVKVESPDIAHKTEAGAVVLHIRDMAALRAAATQVLASAKRHDPKARIDGVLVQEMASGVEAIIGAVDDAHFGPVVLFGLGGVFTEIMGDVTHRFAPFDVTTAQEMIAETRGAKLLAGYRGKPACDVEALAQALSRISLLISDHSGRIAEIDVNPLFVRAAGEGVVAADALVVLKA
jgi:acyl-CoA synthetase (NDP forming)